MNILQVNKGGTGSATSNILDTGDDSEKEVVFVSGGMVEFRDSPSYVKLQGSNNNSSWNDIKSYSFNVNGPFQGFGMNTELIATSYRYLRIYLSNSNGGSNAKGAIVSNFK